MEPDLLCLDQLEGELGAVDAALHRLSEGTYGCCDVCGDPISEDGLDADPLARGCCADHQREE